MEYKEVYSDVISSTGEFEKVVRIVECSFQQNTYKNIDIRTLFVNESLKTFTKFGISLNIHEFNQLLENLKNGVFGEFGDRRQITIKKHYSMFKVFLTKYNGTDKYIILTKDDITTLLTKQNLLEILIK